MLFPSLVLGERKENLLATFSSAGPLQAELNSSPNIETERPFNVMIVQQYCDREV